LLMLLLPLNLDCFLRDPSVPVSGCPLQRGNFKGGKKAASGAKNVAGKPKTSKPKPKKTTDKPAPKKQGGSCKVPAKKNSFVPGTKVVMADGSTKNIEDLKEGEYVLASDPETGNLQARQITNTRNHEGVKDLIVLTIDADGKDGKAKPSKITSTDAHLFWLPDFGRWVTAGELKPGIWLRTATDDWVQVTAVNRIQRTQRVYNLTVEGVHTFFVTVSGAAVLTHNEGIEACGIGKPSGIPRHAKKKTGAASGGKPYLSGWSAKKPKAFEKMDIADVSQVRTNMGMPQASHSWGNGVVGRYNNSHVEKQAIVDNVVRLPSRWTAICAGTVRSSRPGTRIGMMWTSRSRIRVVSGYSEGPGTLNSWDINPL
ncbi:Hint domain-containing protein, partial [Streptomyces atratus]|uniref:Hint domain-containing protein n=1 Tax=Streptomyces atratus TaxID=1893 RepID=UPI0033EBEC3B